MSKVKITLIILNIIMLLAALVWLMKDQSLEPLVTSIGLISSLIALLYSSSEKDGEVKMKQKGGKKSKNYQSVGDINFGKKDDVQ